MEDVVEALSNLSRTGWMLRGVPHGLAETVAEHSFHASIIALEVSLRLRDRGCRIDPYKAAAIALVHDLGEAVIGDIPRTASLGEAKRGAELEAVSKLPVHVGIKGLIGDFESTGSLEGFIARVSELLATVMKASRYRALGYERVAEIEANVMASVKGMLEGGPCRGELLEAIRGVLGLTLQPPQV